MSPNPATSARAVTSTDELVEWFKKGIERPEHRRVGTEHEKLLLRREDLGAVSYEGPRGIQTILETLADRFNYMPVLEKGLPIGLYRMTPDGVESISLEPGGQFELSGAPFRLLSQTEQELDRHLAEVAQVLDELDLLMVSTSFNPIHELDEVPWMPKGRYVIMRNYMPRVGTRGLWMMKGTCTVQANLDFTSEDDAADMMRTAMWLTPLVSAMFANSPLWRGKPSGYHTTRCHIWMDTDNERAGFPDFMLEGEEITFQRYVEWALDVPMYLLYRDGHYLDLTRQRLTFRDYMARGFEGHHPTLDDFETHISTLFPEVRLKRKYIEMRGADMGPRDNILALPALWKGVLYDLPARAEARALLDDLDPQQRRDLFDRVTRWTLDAPIPGRLNGSSATVRELALELVRIAMEGLDRLALPSDQSPDAPPIADPDERHYLQPLLDDLRNPEGSRPTRQLARWRELGGDTAAWLREQAIVVPPR